MDMATVDHLLTTTRSVKKRMDFSRPVEPEVLERCIETALYAPTGSNHQGWHFVVVTDPAKRTRLAEYYRKGNEAVTATTLDPGYHPPQWAEGDVRRTQLRGMRDASTYLRDHFHEVPAHIIGCIEREMEEVWKVYSPQYESFHVASLCTGLYCPPLGQSCWPSALAAWEPPGPPPTWCTKRRSPSSSGFPIT